MTAAREAQTRYKAERNREIIRLYTEEEYTLQEVAARSGVTPQRVAQILKGHGIPRRTVGRPFEGGF